MQSKSKQPLGCRTPVPASCVAGGRSPSLLQGGKRFIVVFVLPIVLVSCGPSPDQGQSLLQNFSDSVSSNKNLPTIVTWARGVLANSPPPTGPERTSIARSALPRELFDLYHGPNSAGTVPLASVWSQGGTNSFVAINFFPGSVYRFSLFIGHEDFRIPTNSLRRWEEIRKGVVAALDWP